jgi:pimeloyl-ACP methyl ester carboxylesterase
MAATVVLVHGAWHGAWCWERVVEQLTEQGIDAIAVDLPGHGEDAGALTDLHGDAARVREVLETIDDRVLLVGHSYGGAVVTEAGVHPSVAHLVYVAAFAIHDEESCGNAGAEEPAAAAIDHRGRPDLSSMLLIDEQGVARLPPEGAAEAFFNDCDERSTQWAVSRLDGQRLESLLQSPIQVAWHEKPSTYLVCTEDQAVHPDLQRLLAARCTEVIDVRSGHSPFLSQPDLLAELLTERANRF